MARPAIALRAALRGIVVLFTFLALPVLAGDRANLNVFGFSLDGQYFAFEEYGYQDGSGFAFSNIYLIDLDRDVWVSGSPFRLMAETEEEHLYTIREQNYEAAQEALHSAGIDYPAEIAALNGDGERGNDGRTIRFGLPSYGLSEPQDDYTIAIETFPATSPEPCEDYMGQAPLGFALTVTSAEREEEIYRDDTLPASRGCPWDYRLFAVLTPSASSALDRSVVIVSTYPHGFEGPDRRFVAIPFELWTECPNC
jgi:predicted secreted protein